MSDSKGKRPLSLSSKHLFGLLTALGKRAFSNASTLTEAEKEEIAAFSNEALMSQIQCSDESEIVIVEQALGCAMKYMWNDDSLRSFLSGASINAAGGAGGGGTRGGGTGVIGTGTGAGRGPETGVGEESISPVELSITDEQIGAFLKYWGENKEKLRARLVQQACWNQQYQNLTWRVDLRALTSDARAAEEGGNKGAGTGTGAGGDGGDEAVPMAYFELQKKSLVGTRTNTDTGSGTGTGPPARFEMTHPEVQGFTQALDDIYKAIGQAS